MEAPSLCKASPMGDALKLTRRFSRHDPRINNHTKLRVSLTIDLDKRSLR